MTTDVTTFTAEELNDLRETIRGAFDKSTDLPATLELLGAEDLAQEGGLALSVLLEELGRVAMPSDILGMAVRSALGLDVTGGAALAFPVPGTSRVATIDGRGADIAVQGLIAGASTEAILVGDEEGRLHLVDASDPRLEVSDVAGLEPRAEWKRISGIAIALETPADAGTLWAGVVPLIRRALAAQLLGASREMLRIAVDHVTTREQFGHPIGSFQAVRHRLAETFVAVTAAEAALALSWRESGHDSENLALVAKASAGLAFESATKNCVQVCGAMGLTYEHPLHFLVRFGTVRNALFGTPAELSREIGWLLLGGEVPLNIDPLVDEE